MPPKGKKNKGRTKHAAPRFIQNADELANRDEEMAAQKAQRKARRKEAGCSDSEEDEDDVDDDAGGFLGAAADMARLKMADIPRTVSFIPATARTAGFLRMTIAQLPTLHKMKLCEALRLSLMLILLSATCPVP